jgi:ABC-type multidrug transport system permease subunit
VEQAYEDAVMYEGFIQPIIEQDEEFVAQGRTFETHHPHNAFLTYWLAVGIGGVLLLIALFLIAAMLPVGRNRIFLWLFLLALFLQCMTEPIGGHLLPQFIALMLFVWEKTCNPDTHEYIA